MGDGDSAGNGSNRETRPWDSLLRALRDRRIRARAMGGEQRLERRKAQGRLNARERVARLCDPDSFRELGTLVGGLTRSGLAPAPADALVGGIGRIDGRPIVVFAEDFTVQGGSIGLGNQAKRVRLAELALQERVPLVMLLEGAGERATNALERYPRTPNDLQLLAQLSGQVPTVAVIMGSSAGHGALCGLLADFIVMVEGSALFSAGPPLVRAALGEEVTKEELGGAEMHARTSGVVHNLVGSDEAALAMVRDYLGYFPSSGWETAPIDTSSADSGKRSLDGLVDIIPEALNRPYDMKRVIEQLADDGRMLEVQPLYGAAMLTVLARIGGQPVAVVANQPSVWAGAIDKAAAEKAAHFLEVASAYSLPVVFLADNPGILSGSAAERAGTLRAAARMYGAQSRVRSPKLHVTLRKAFGFGSSIMAMNPFDSQTLTLAFPTVTLGALPAGSGGDAAKLEGEQRASLAESQGSAWGPADSMAFDEIIEPSELRDALLDGLALSRSRVSQPTELARTTGIRP